MRPLYPLLFLVLAAAMVCSPGPASAQTNANQLGLYTDLAADPASASIDVEPYTQFDVHLFISNPHHFDYFYEGELIAEGHEITDIAGFYLRLRFPDSGFVKLAELPNADAYSRVGNEPEYAFGFPVSIPVPESKVVLLMTFTFMALDDEPKEIFLEPSQIHPYAGSLRIVDANWQSYDDSEIAFPASGDIDLPVFGINTNVLPASGESWGGVKALFR